MPRPSRIAAKAGLVLGSTLLTLLLAEWVMRGREPPPVIMGVVERDRANEDAGLFEPAPAPLLFVPAEGRTVLHGKTNALGLRDREYSRDKPPGVFRIVVLGDSIAWGAGVEMRQNFENLLEDRLIAEGRCVEILNVSVAGYNAVMEEAYLALRGLPLQPDLVLPIIGLNDQTETPVLTWNDDSISFLFQQRPGMDNVPWTLRLPWGLDRWLMSNSAVIRAICRVLASPDTPNYKRLVVENRVAMLGMADRSRAAGARIVFFVLPNLDNFEPYRHQVAHDDLRRYLEAWGEEAVDLLPAVREASNGNAETLRLDPNDDLHPGHAGHSMLAGLLHAELLRRELVPPPTPGSACEAAATGVQSP